MYEVGCDHEQPSDSWEVPGLNNLELCNLRVVFFNSKADPFLYSVLGPGP